MWRATLRSVLRQADAYPAGFALFMPMDEEWAEETSSVIEDVDSINDPDSGVIELEGQNFEYALEMSVVQSIVRNALAQRSAADDRTLLLAFLHYYDHDAFIDLQTM
jgi:hypothetical protein